MDAQALSIEEQYTNKKVALIGYGVTGKACAQYLLNKGAVVSVFDRATHNTSADEAAKLRFYSLNENTQLHGFDMVVVSPGVNLQQTFIQSYLKGVASNQSSVKVNNLVNRPCVIGDIELFAREFAYKKAKQSTIDTKHATKIIGITGSNGKSTVVDMLSKALTNAGLKVGLGGNFGTSALHMLEQDYDLIVLELSSFQLESTYSLALDVACVLNVTPDHIDRHGTMQAYAQAKRKIYQDANFIIYNRDDPQTLASTYVFDSDNSASFGIAAPIEATEVACYFQNEKGVWLRFGKTQSVEKVLVEKDSLLLSTASLLNLSDKNSNDKDAALTQRYVSDHQLLNMQVVFACCHALAHTMDFDFKKVEHSLCHYKGLAHRFETVRSDHLGTWINDSKATNSGASIAAIKALVGRQKELILIAGGDAKNADLADWFALVNRHVKHTILIGKDGPTIASQLNNCEVVNNLAAAVSLAKTYLQQTQQGIVLLSPACASIDMFDNFQQRGDIFTQLVRQQVAA